MRLRSLFITVTFLFFSLYTIGQNTYIEQFQLPISNYEKESFKVDIQSGDIEITGSSDNKISISAEVFNAPGKNYKCGYDGCMNVERSDFKFSIKPREGEKVKKIQVLLPSNTPIKIKLLGSGSVLVTKMYGEIQIISGRVGNISLKQVKGPLSLFGTYGNIDVEFDNGISKQPMALTLLKGNINILIPKNEKLTIASYCPDHKSTIKDYPVKSVSIIKQKVDTSKYDVRELEKSSMNINLDYKERIESRDFFGFRNKKTNLSNVRFVEDVWVYDINGGGTDIELKIYQGSIQIDESK